MLTAFVDASRRKVEGLGNITAVSATVFGPDSLKKAERAWRRLWPESFHMTDFISARKSPYQEFRDAARAERKLVEMVGVLKRYALYGITISCSMEEAGQYAPDPRGVPLHHGRVTLSGLGTPYGLCLHALMQHLADRTRNRRKNIRYILEQGDVGQGAFAEFVRHFGESKAFKAIYNFESLRIVASEQCRLLETSDYLAWEGGKLIARSVDGSAPRPTFARLFMDDASSERPYAEWKFHGNHLEGEVLGVYYQELKRVAEARDDEALEEIFRRHQPA